MDNKLDSEEVYIEAGQQTFFDPEMAISYLLKNQVLFSNYRKYEAYENSFSRTCVLFVNCNDIFAWGCADAEDLPSEEALEALYKLCVQYPTWGSAIWCCQRRKMQPQRPVAEYMKKANEWPAEIMDSLEKNSYDAYCERVNKQTTSP